jgi:hypothetical protein
METVLKNNKAVLNLLALNQVVKNLKAFHLTHPFISYTQNESCHNMLLSNRKYYSSTLHILIALYYAGWCGRNALDTRIYS